MKNWLETHAQNNPDVLALVSGDEQWTYGALARDVRLWAAALQARGVGAGDRVGLLAENSAQWVIAAHAIWWVGATVVGFHHRAAPGEWDALLARVEPALLITDDLRGELQFDRCKKVTFSELARGLDGGEIAGEARPQANDQILSILFTSGSTGRPKAVPLTTQNHLASANASARRIGREENDRWLCCLPLCHIGGLAIVVRSAVYGTAVELMSRFDEEQVLHILEDEPITLASLVPTMLTRLVDASAGRLKSSLRCVLVGGGPIDELELRRARAAGIPVVPTYGMTEGCSQLATLSPDEPDEFLNTAGRALDGVELAIVDVEGQPVGPGEIGRILVRGPMVTSGYLDAQEDRDYGDPWFDTRDFGAVDDDGYLVVAHRRGERIVSGGENISPAEVEALLRRSPEVADVAVVGVDDALWGQAVAALVVAARPELDRPLNVELLEALCRRELAPYKVPRRWAEATAIPRGSTGKVDRREVRRYFDAPTPDGGA